MRCCLLLSHSRLLPSRGSSSPTLIRLRGFRAGPFLLSPRDGSNRRDDGSSPAEPEAKSTRLDKGFGSPKQTRLNITKQLQPIETRPAQLQPTHKDLPTRIIPKPQISPDLTLTPEERLRLELRSRRRPKPAEKPSELSISKNELDLTFLVFKERLLIYHGGVSYNNYIAILRVLTIFAASLGIMLLGPAYLTSETAPWWTGPLSMPKALPMCHLTRSQFWRAQWAHFSWSAL